MNRLPMSPAAAQLLRALLDRCGRENRDRILLTEIRSTDWHSLTMVGERHALHFRISGPNAARLAARLTDGLEDAEFALSRQIVADIVQRTAPLAEGAVEVAIEALTVSD